MAYDERKFLARVEVNAKQAIDSVQRLEAEETKAREKLVQLKRKDSGATKEQIKVAEQHWKATKKALSDERKYAQGLSESLNTLSSKNYKDLQKEVRSLQNLMRNGTVEKGSEEWKLYAERIKAAKRELKEYREATEETQSIVGRFMSFLNTNWGAFVQIAASVTGITMTAHKAVNAYASMEEEMANVQKYSGLAEEEVRELNEEFKNMDTRTSREHLNELAGAAGRLGITSKEAIKEFVEGADMISVALGDDLGDGAVDQIGKLAMAFGEDEKMGLRGAMLATGSAVNELAQNSSAQAGYLVDFTARVAGFGKQIGLTQAQIMGFGAVMDENLLRDEMAATAFGNMLTKMQTDTEKFARIAGKSVEEFTQLLNTDANAAILALADNLKRADPTTMMKMLDDMGLDGSRAVGVLSTLADKIDDVRVRQELATKAYADGTSVISEFDRMNQTVQAGIDKAMKAFHEILVELGYNLQPVIKYTISGTSLLVRTLLTMIDVVKNCRVTIMAATAALVMWNAAALKALVVTKVTAAVKACRTAFIALTSALKVNPWVALASVVATVVAGIIEFTSRTKSATKSGEELSASAQRVKNAQERVGKSADDLTGKYRALQEQWKKLSTEHQKQQWIKENQSAFAELGISINTVHDAQMKLVRDSAKVVAALKATATAAALQSMLQESVTKREEFLRQAGGKVKYKKVSNRREDLSQDEWSAVLADRKANAGALAMQGRHVDDRTLTQQEINKVTGMRVAAARSVYQEQLKLYDDEIDYYAKQMTAAYDEINKAKQDKVLDYDTGGGDSKGGKNTPKTEDPLKKRERELKEEYDMQVLIEKQALAVRLKDTQITQQEIKDAEDAFNEALHQKKIDYYTKVRDLYAQDSAEWVQWEDKRVSEQSAYDKKVTENKLKELEKQTADRQKEIEKQRKLYGDLMTEIAPVDSGDELQAQQNRLKAIENMMQDFRNKGIISEEEYQSALDAIRAAHAEIQKQQTETQIEKTHEAVQFALQQVAGVISGISAYVSACYQAETAQVTARYDKEIAAAKKAGKDTTKLEEKKQKELNSIKLRQIEAETEAQQAQALINIALGVTKAIAEYVWPYNLIVAGITTAMGMVQLATIQKQAEAQKAALSGGYYEGGFTGGKNYRREAGVVHEGEFVANHTAVNNPYLTPMFSLLDQAQRNNTVGSLRPEDVTNVMGGPAAQVVAPVVNVMTDNSDLRESLGTMNETITRLSDQIDDGLGVNFSMSEFDKNKKHYDKLMQ